MTRYCNAGAATHVARRPVPPGRHRREVGDGRAAARQHLDLGDHHRPRLRHRAASRRGNDQLRARILEGRRYRPLLRGARPADDLPSAKVLRRRDRRMAPLDRRQGRSTARARARGSPPRWTARSRAEADRLAERLNFLATVGSVAPFVGLFGTVWGIMRSFIEIAGAQQYQPRGGRAGHLRGAVRHRDRPVRGDPGGDRLQPLQPRHEPPRGAAAALRRRLPRDAQPRAGDARPDGDGPDPRQRAARRGARRWRRSTSRRWST